MLAKFIQKDWINAKVDVIYLYNVAGSPTAQSVGGFLTGMNPKNPDPSQE